MGFSKIESQIIHTKKRAKERFGLELNDSNIKELTEKILNGYGFFVSTQGKHKTLWDLLFMGKRMRVVFNESTLNPITVLYTFGM